MSTYRVCPRAKKTSLSMAATTRGICNERALEVLLLQSFGRSARSNGRPYLNLAVAPHYNEVKVERFSSAARAQIPRNLCLPASPQAWQLSTMVCFAAWTFR